MRNTTTKTVFVNSNDDCTRTNVSGNSVVRANGILALRLYLHLALRHGLKRLRQIRSRFSSRWQSMDFGFQQMCITATAAMCEPSPSSAPAPCVSVQLG